MDVVARLRTNGVLAVRRTVCIPLWSLWMMKSVVCSTVERIEHWIKSETFDLAEDLDEEQLLMKSRNLDGDHQESSIGATIRRPEIAKGAT